MIPIRKPPISQKRKAAAITVAGIADLLQIFLLPALLPGLVLDELVDFITAIALIAICGFKWQFVLAFLMELVPGLDLLPTWSAVALLIPSHPQQVFVSTPPVQNPHGPIEVTSVAIPPVQGTPRPHLP